MLITAKSGLSRAAGMDGAWRRRGRCPSHCSRSRSSCCCTPLSRFEKAVCGFNKMHLFCALRTAHARMTAAARFIDGCFDILLEHSLENLILIDQKYYKTAKLVNNTIIM